LALRQHSHLQRSEFCSIASPAFPRAAAARARIQRVSDHETQQVLDLAAELFDIQKDAKSWEAIGAWAPGGQNVGTSAEPLRVTSAAITRGLIDALGVQPELGRNFSAEEDRVGGANVAIISPRIVAARFRRRKRNYRQADSGQLTSDHRNAA
jgi:hypothetical protein